MFYPKTTRIELRNQLYTTLTTSHACFSISAPGNFGKSHLLRELAQSSLVASVNPPPLLVYVDFNLQAADSLQGCYELILRIVLNSLQNYPVATADNLLKLSQFYEILVGDNNSPFTIARSFLAALDLIMQILAGRLVLLFDEFDYSLQTLEPSALRHLRALKDRYPERLIYIVATNLPILSYGRDDNPDVAEFYELFDLDHLVRLTGLTREESASLACQYAPTLTQPQLERLYTLAGGHPTLTRLLAPQIEQDYTLLGVEGAAKLQQNLRLDPRIRRECSRIWDSLASSEKQALLQHLEGIKTLDNGSLLGSLSERHLVTSHLENSTSVIFAQVFEWFVQEQQLQTVSSNLTTQESLVADSNVANALPIAYSPRREEVFFEGGKRSLRLIGNAAILFTYLFMRQSEPYCTKDELITKIWGNAGYSSENLDRLVSDVRQSIGDVDKQIIRTIPRRGLQMVGVSEWSGPLSSG
jgi:hypothetical protein